VDDQQLYDRRRRRLQSIELSDRDFQETKNPAYAWDAIGECLAIGVEFPPHTRAYLWHVARQITGFSRSPRIPTKGDITRAIVDAVGIKGRGQFNPFRELLRPGHEIGVAMDVYHFQGQHQHYTWTAIFKAVATAHRRRCDLDFCGKHKPISWQTVRKCWYAHARTVIPPSLQKRSHKLDDILR
jgi:hypothetical protein